jgi:hypothetical protein
VQAIRVFGLQLRINPEIYSRLSMIELDRIHSGICTAQAGTWQNRPPDVLDHKRPPGDPARPQREPPTWQPAFQVLPTSKRGTGQPSRPRATHSRPEFFRGTLALLNSDLTGTAEVSRPTRLHPASRKYSLWPFQDSVALSSIIALRRLYLYTI